MSGNEPRFDRSAAFAYYAALPETRRTFVAVGERFGVSDTAVRKVAKRERWRQRVREIELRARRQMETRIVRDRARELERTLEIIALAENDLLERLRAGDAEVRVADLPALVKLRELLLGGATDRIEAAEVKTVIHAVIAIAGQFIPEKARSDFVLAVADATAAIGPAEELESLDEDDAS